MEALAVTIRHSRIMEKREYSFLELLLDDRLSDGEILAPLSVRAEAGGENRRLGAKRRYEWLLRLAEEHPVIGEPGNEESAGEEGDPKEAFRTDCYVTSRYADLLRREGQLETVMAALISMAEASSDKDGYLRIMEEMLGRGPAYRWLHRATEPVLLYYGPTWCYNALNVLMDGLKEGLLDLGIPVQVYDGQKEDVYGLPRFFGQSFQAVADVQSWLFPVRLKEQDCFLHDKINGLKLDIILDHPVWLKQNLEQLPKETVCLTHDPHYRDFIRDFYPEAADAYVFPPAGKTAKEREETVRRDRPVGLLFIGTYGDYRKKVAEIRASAHDVKRLALTFLKFLKREPYLTAEAAFKKTLKELEIEVEGEEFLNLLFACRSVVQLIMFYFREKIIKTLLEGGVEVEIYGGSWKEAPFSDHPLLHLHEDVTYEESLALFQRAKLSLNIMAWHKGGFTERMANSMLNGAVVLTDETDHPGLEDDGNLCMFSLQELKSLPHRVKKLLSAPEELERIRENAYAYASQRHTWRARAKELLGIIDREDEKWLQGSM